MGTIGGMMAVICGIGLLFLIIYKEGQTSIFVMLILFVVGLLLVIISKIIKRSKMSPEEKDRLRAEKVALEVAYKESMRKRAMEDMETNRRAEQAGIRKATNSEIQQWGELNSQMVCPHCQTKGMVRIKSVSNKKGISGGKATAAILTGGWSILGTGLSRKEKGTQAHCDNCKNTWAF